MKMEITVSLFVIVRLLLIFEQDSDEMILVQKLHLIEAEKKRRTELMDAPLLSNSYPKNKMDDANTKNDFRSKNIALNR